LYCCLLMDFEDGTIIDVLPDRKKDYLAGYFTKVRLDTYDEKTGKSELDNVRYVSIDLYEPYKLIAQIYFPKALICADPFHVLKHLTEAFRAVRLRCRRNTEDENLQYLLTKFKHIFSHGFNLDNDPKYNKRFKRRMNYRDMQTILFERFPDLKKAYELKEGYILFNESCSVQNAKEMLADQIQQFGDSGISEYAGFYNLLINWNEEIIHSFSTVSGRRINNSYIESRNNQPERLMMNANGYKCQLKNVQF
ncbi:transposase, partial [uncultured Traorella sp.]|uniref:transposase n=1 Tax=uncultured Traorella sp. TaxID=1929048 RepID=UPI0025CD8A06